MFQDTPRRLPSWGCSFHDCEKYNGRYVWKGKLHNGHPLYEQQTCDKVGADAEGLLYCNTDDDCWMVNMSMKYVLQKKGFLRRDGIELFRYAW